MSRNLQSPPAIATKELYTRNRQRLRSIDLRLLDRQFRLVGKAARLLLEELLSAKIFEVGIHLVDAAQMTRLNETFLRHAGSTDVVTFSYSSQDSEELHGDILICLDEAVVQARRFRTTWQAELARYLIHGVLHMLGHDDATSARRRKMKREENRLLRELGRRIPLRQLDRATINTVNPK